MSSSSELSKITRLFFGSSICILSETLARFSFSIFSSTRSFLIGDLVVFGSFFTFSFLGFQIGIDFLLIISNSSKGFYITYTVKTPIKGLLF